VIISRLHIKDGGDHYAIEVAESSGTEQAEHVVAAGQIPLTLPPLPGQQATAKAVELLPQLLLVHQAATATKPSDAGAYLYRLLADHGLGAWLEDVRSSRPEPRRVRVRVEDEQLRRLPWEMVMEPRSEWAPFLDPNNRWTRESARHTELTPLAPPVRVLFVAGAYDDVKLHADDELDAVMRALCRQPADFDVEYLVAPTEGEFNTVYADVQPHVLHVVAHGEQSSGETVLSLRTGEVGAWSLTRFQVANVLPSCPRLVVLNACRTGFGDAGPNAAWNFAELFEDKGAGAVVTMQGDIPADAAVAFTEVFYTQLAAHAPVDVAAQEGRRAILHVSHSASVWSIPTLTQSAPPDRVLAIREHRKPPLRLEAVVTDAVTWVDRSTERRRLWTRASPEGSEPPRLIVVTGGNRMGKSAVVKGALPVCHARGCDIAYVDFGGPKRLGWFAAVKQAHDDLHDWLPEYDDAIRQFAHLAETCRTGVYFKDDGSPRREFGDDLVFENEADLGDHRKTLIFRELCELIRSCAGENKLLLVLDNIFIGLSDEARDDYILPKLVQPLLDDVQSNVVLVTVMPQEQTLSLRNTGDRMAEVRVKGFEKSAYELLLREYVARSDIARSELAVRLPPERKARVKQLAKMTDTWDVKVLRKLGKVALL
jgi:hypothetical protein